MSNRWIYDIKSILKRSKYFSYSWVKLPKRLMPCENQSWYDNHSLLFFYGSLSHSKSLCEMFMALVLFFFCFCFFFVVVVLFCFFFDKFSKNAKSLIDLRFHIPSRCLGGRKVMGNSIAKNIRVSVGFPGVTVVNHHKDNGLWLSRDMNNILTILNHHKFIYLS